MEFDVQNPGWLMISWGIILPYILGITTIQERGIPINQPLSFFFIFAVSTAPFSMATVNALGIGRRTLLAEEQAGPADAFNQALNRLGLLNDAATFDGAVNRPCHRLHDCCRPAWDFISICLGF